MSFMIILFLVLGLFFFTVGVIGVLRLPDFYTRLHAAGKSDSLAVVLMLIGAALYNLQQFSPNNLLVSIKIMFIAVFIYVASPTATHAIAKAALVMGVTPWSKGKKRL